MFHVRMGAAMRFPRRVLGPGRTCLELTPGSVQAAHLLLLLFSVGIPCLMLLYSQHIISHVAAGLLFSGPPKGWPFLARTKNPLWELSLQTTLMALALLAQGPRPRLSRRENPDFVFPEQESVDPSKRPFPFNKLAG